MSDTTLKVSGKSPFERTGTYEVFISILDKNPSAAAISKGTYTPLWRKPLHLYIDDGAFSEVLGDDTDPLPESVFENDRVYVLVQDQLSDVHTVLQVDIKNNKPKTKPVIEKKSKTNPEPSIRKVGSAGERGVRGPAGDKGLSGPSGPPGNRGPQGPTGDKGSFGDKGLTGQTGPVGDKGISGPAGPRGSAGVTGPPGDKGPSGSKGLTGDKGDRGDKGSPGPQGIKGDKGQIGLIGDKGPSGS